MQLLSPNMQGMTEYGILSLPVLPYKPFLVSQKQKIVIKVVKSSSVNSNASWITALTSATKDEIKTNERTFFIKAISKWTTRLRNRSNLKKQVWDWVSPSKHFKICGRSAVLSLQFITVETLKYPWFYGVF